MSNGPRKHFKNLGELEQLVTNCGWSQGPSSAEACREALASVRPMKDSTVRSVLRRLEEKGYLTHKVDGRTYVYRATEPGRDVAARAARHIIDRFCGGSVEQFLVGMVENAVLKPRELEQLARKISKQKDEPR